MTKIVGRACPFFGDGDGRMRPEGHGRKLPVSLAAAEMPPVGNKKLYNRKGAPAPLPNASWRLKEAKPLE